MGRYDFDPEEIRQYGRDAMLAMLAPAPPTNETPDPDIVTVHLWIGTCESCGTERTSLKLGLCPNCRPKARP